MSLRTAIRNTLQPIRGAASVVFLSLWLVPALRAERINHEGRILGTQPTVTQPVLFNTAAGDAIISTMQIFPTDSAWNEDISTRPVLSNSAAMISMITNELLVGRHNLRIFKEMNYVFVPDSQPLVPIDLFNYPDESDPSPYPIPTNMPVEGWPSETAGLTLAEWQEDINNDGGDRHSIIVQPGTASIWETWLTKRVGANWEASNGAKFDLNSNTLRTPGWTSGDAAGLPMFPALIRYDECERGVIEHALRLIVKHTRAEYIYPATHYASSPYTTNPNIPAMGQRLRLKASFTIPGHWTKQEKAVATALKKYGAIMADNGNFFSVSAAPDDRFPANAFDNLSSIMVTNFEVVLTTGVNEGPRSPGKPIASAGSDRIVDHGAPIALQGSYSVTGGTPNVQWSLYSGPDTGAIANATLTNATVTFGAPGQYTLLLRVSDGLHTPAYDAVVLTVQNNLRLDIQKTSTNVALNWTGAYPPFVLQQSTNLLSNQWSVLRTSDTASASFPATNLNAFFRVTGK